MPSRTVSVNIKKPAPKASPNLDALRALIDSASDFATALNQHRDAIDALDGADFDGADLDVIGYPRDQYPALAGALLLLQATIAVQDQQTATAQNATAPRLLNMGTSYVSAQQKAKWRFLSDLGGDQLWQAGPNLFVSTRERR